MWTHSKPNADPFRNHSTRKNAHTFKDFHHAHTVMGFDLT
jgi:hypothetical protein